MLQISFLIFSNASACTVDQLHGLFFCINSLNSADKDARFGMILLYWLIDPISDLIFLIQLGSFRLLIASDLCIFYGIPILWPILLRLLFFTTLITNFWCSS